MFLCMWPMCSNLATDDDDVLCSAHQERMAGEPLDDEERDTILLKLSHLNERQLARHCTAVLNAVIASSAAEAETT